VLTAGCKSREISNRKQNVEDVYRGTKKNDEKKGAELVRYGKCPRMLKRRRRYSYIYE